ncbi:MAG TPA: glycosyltransferase family 1 protein [Bryobacteraceae bacterium]
MKVALDATYSIGPNLSGVGVYSRAILFGLAQRHPEAEYSFCYRPHRFRQSFSETLPRNCRRAILWNGWPSSPDLFHGLNQRIDSARYRRTVATFHDLFVMTGDYSTPEFRQRFTEQARTAAKRSDLIIAVSHFTAGQVEELLKVEPARIRVVPHGARPLPWRGALAKPQLVSGQGRPARKPVANGRGSETLLLPSRDRKGAVVPERQQMILFVGALQRRKNIVRLVEAFEETASGWTLVLAGSLGFGAEEILARIERSPRKADIQTPGYVPNTTLEELYQRASVFAFPSLDEGFGLPVLDAMASGIPVLTSNASALTEVSGDAALLVDPLDAASIAAGLRKLTEDQTLRDELVRKGVERSKEFTWEKSVEQTWNVYRELRV